MDLALGRDGGVWVAAHKMGLLRLAADRTLEQRSPPGERIYSVEIDSEGSLWACGFDRLFRGDAHSGSLIPVEHGLGEVGGCRRVAAGSNGSLYVSTARGLLWTDGETWRLAGGPTTEADMLYGLLVSRSGCSRCCRT